ncbi:MAG: hypothetical protein L6Q57_00585 [Alphaproteobacteria bacterium]|nr:hypothetical protein [Alphaproteobacteria bacterium]
MSNDIPEDCLNGIYSAAASILSNLGVQGAGGGRGYALKLVYPHGHPDRVYMTAKCAQGSLPTIREKFSGVSGIIGVRSSGNGQLIWIEFEPGTDVLKTLQALVPAA